MAEFPDFVKIYLHVNILLGQAGKLGNYSLTQVSYFEQIAT